MANPTTRAEFIENCLRRLGKPVTFSSEKVKDNTVRLFFDSCKVNKYSIWYFNIILRALQRQTVDGYTENHHYIPKSFGGLDTVPLSAKEHFICHLLLVKMFEGEYKSKMSWAILCMQGNKKYSKNINSLLYESIKSNLSHSTESKLKMSAARLGTQQGKNNNNYGNRGKLNPLFGKQQSDNHKQKRILALTNRVRSEQERNNISAGKKGRHIGKRWFNDGLTEKHGFLLDIPTGWKLGRLPKNSIKVEKYG